jgi:VWFA-related protein
MVAADAWPQSGQPTFRTATDVVYVSATVLGPDGHLVTDLTRNDFAVRADGVPREITVFHSEQIPFAVSIWFDISLSEYGRFPLMAAAVSELVKHFGPGDRANVGSFNGLPSMTSRFTANRRTLTNWVNASLGGEGAPCFAGALDGLAGPAAADTGNSTALWAAVACGIQAVGSDAETPRHVVLIVTDGVDNASGIDERQVEDLANESGTMVYVVAAPGSAGLDRAALEALADRTGGGYLLIPAFDQLASAFAQVADELRHQYVIGFPPSSITGQSHNLSIDVRRPGTRVRFRHAYTVSQPAAPGPPPDMRADIVRGPLTVATPSIALTSPEVLTQLDRFLNGEFGVASQRFGSSSDFLKAFEALRNAAPLWISAVDADGRPRRRLAVAAYALDLVASQPDALWAPPSLSVSGVLDWTRSVLDNGSPSAAERVWYSAAAGLLERFEPRANRSEDVPSILRLVADGERRFPNDPWWSLERALERELRSWPDARDGPPPWWAFDVSPAIDLYDHAAEAASVRAEAEIRSSFLFLRRARLFSPGAATDTVDARLSDVALAQVQARLDAAGRPDTPALRYLQNLFRGMALERAGRLAEAVTAFRAAFSTAPYAQSVTVALGSALAESGHGDEAATLLSRMWDIAPARFDPWFVYPFPHYQYVNESRDRLHAALRP